MKWNSRLLQTYLALLSITSLLVAILAGSKWN